MRKKGHDLPKCSFWGKSQEMVRRLVAGSLLRKYGQPVYICNECHALIVDSHDEYDG